MAYKITKEYIDGRFARISKMVEYLSGGKFSLHIDYSGDPVRPRISLTQPNQDDKDKYRIVRDLSPRASLKDMALWIDAFEEGLSIADM